MNGYYYNWENLVSIELSVIQSQVHKEHFFKIIKIFPASSSSQCNLSIIFSPMTGFIPKMSYLSQQKTATFSVIQTDTANTIKKQKIVVICYEWPILLGQPKLGELLDL